MPLLSEGRLDDSDSSLSSSSSSSWAGGCGGATPTVSTSGRRRLEEVKLLPAPQPPSGLAKPDSIVTVLATSGRGASCTSGWTGVKS